MKTCLFLLLCMALLSVHPLPAQPSLFAAQEPDSIMQQMLTLEKKYKDQVAYYKVHISKNGRKSKITGINQDTTYGGRNSLSIVCVEKSKSGKKGVTLQTISYYRSNENRETKKEVFIDSKKRVLRKTLVNDKLVSAEFISPANYTQFIINGQYFRSNTIQNKKIPKDAYIKN